MNFIPKDYQGIFQIQQNCFSAEFIFSLMKNLKNLGKIINRNNLVIAKKYVNG